VRRPPVAAAAIATWFAVCLTAPPAPAAGQGTVPGELRRLLAAGAISPERHDGWRAAWDDAVRTHRRLDGARRRALGAVLSNTRSVAAAGLLTPTRGAALLLTVQRNRAWWASRPLLGSGARVTFPGSELVWQHYPGQGLQLQWLATFARANALFTGRVYDTRLRALLDEAVPLATARAGGLAWEYAFRFDGGRPPWVSALAQGTAVQALARAAVRLGDPRLFEVARAGLGVFRTPPPEGVRVQTPAGAHYLIYSFAPRLRVLNGFVQSLNGLLDFARLANDAEGAGLFAAGEAQLAAELQRYDTGAWSRYSLTRESDLGYHVLVRDFLRGLCARLEAEPARAARYCETAARFDAYLRTAPELALVEPARPPDDSGRVGRTARVRFSLSKISTVTATASRRGRVVWTRTARLGRGRHAFALRPTQAGPLTLALRAVDLAGNAATTGGVLHVRPRRR
jgi:D-glucuronyl C5-epimerase-like protein